MGLATAFLSLFLWLYLLGFRDQYWRADQRLSDHMAPVAWPSITVIIPARNEADSISQVITSHMKSDYPGTFNVILVDDHSEDDTAMLAEKAAQNQARALSIIKAPSLPEGWTGKLWALQTGVAVAVAASEPASDFYLLTDADIAHAPSTLRKLAAKAVHGDLALTSLMARLDARGLWGGLLAPAFIYFFQKLYPFPAANDPWRETAAAAGGCMLVRREALETSGGITPIKDQLIDDCALARQIKGRSERRIWLGLADQEVISLRDNRSLASFWRMVARTAFTQLDYSVGNLLGSVAAMCLIYLIPPLAVLSYPLHESALTALIGGLALILMMVSYAPTLRLYGKKTSAALTLPVAAILYVLMTIASAWRHLRGRGGRWKGRSYQNRQH